MISNDKHSYYKEKIRKQSSVIFNVIFPKLIPIRFPFKCALIILNSFISHHIALHLHFSHLIPSENKIIKHSLCPIPWNFFPLLSPCPWNAKTSFFAEKNERKMCVVDTERSWAEIYNYSTHSFSIQGFFS